MSKNWSRVCKCTYGCARSMSPFSLCVFRNERHSGSRKKPNRKYIFIRRNRLTRGDDDIRELTTSTSCVYLLQTIVAYEDYVNVYWPFRSRTKIFFFDWMFRLELSAIDCGTHVCRHHHHRWCCCCERWRVTFSLSKTKKKRNNFCSLNGCA